MQGKFIRFNKILQFVDLKSIKFQKTFLAQIFIYLNKNPDEENI